MPDELQRIYWDSCVFLSYINELVDRVPMIEAVFAEVRRSQSGLEIITSVLSMVEVAYSNGEQQAGQLSDDVEERIQALWRDRSVVALVEYHELIGHDARALIRRARSKQQHLAGMDAIHLATAKRYGALELQTYDDKLDKFAEDAGLPIVRPRTQTPELFGTAGVTVPATASQSGVASSPARRIRLPRAEWPPSESGDPGTDA